MSEEETAALLRLRDLTLDTPRAEQIYADIANKRMQLAYDRALAESASPREDADSRRSPAP